MTKSLTLVIPTYNESGNILPLVQQLSETLREFHYEILFVDDNSTDGTATIIESLKDRYPVKVIVRRDERGLASAVVKGFGNATGELLVVMDADLQHPPSIVPQLVQAIENGADIAVASRYIAGGGCAEWSGLRKLISRVAILMAKLVLPASRRVKDPMSGFFALSRSVIEGKSLKPIGYKILLEVLVMGSYTRVVEVPFQFQLRELGKSKLNLNQEYEYIRHLLSMMRRSGELARFIKFCIVGGSGVIVNLGLLWLLTEQAGLHYAVSAVFAIETSIITNYLLNNFVTFADRRAKGVKGLLGNLVKFNLVSLGGLVINMAVLTFLTEIAGLFYMLSNVFGIIGATLWNFLINNWWTWRDSKTS